MERKEGSVEAKGRNVEEAIANGLTRLGLKREQVEIEILSRGSRGVLGLGAEDAHVILTPIAAGRPTRTQRAPEPPPAREARAEEKAGAEIEEPARAGPSRQPPPAELDEIPTDRIIRIAREALENLLKHMSVDARVAVREPAGFMLEGDNPPVAVLDVQGDDLGVLIGRRGETLSALQYMVRLIVNQQTHRWYNIIVDVEGYRERREAQLVGLAERMAEQVVSTQRPAVLEAMPPYERRIVHLALRDHPQVTTHSIGEGDSRKVMIHLR